MKIQHRLFLPRGLRWVTYLVMAGVFAGALLELAGLFELTWKTKHLGIQAQVDEKGMLEALPIWLRPVAICLPAAALLYALWRLAALLQLVANGEVFSAPAASYLRSFGVWLLAATLMEKLVPGLLCLAHSLLTQPHGKVRFDFASDDLWNVFLSALFMLVARVLADAYELAEENRQFI